MNPSFRIFKGEFSSEIVSCLDRLDRKFLVYVDSDKRGKHWISNNFVNYKIFYIWGNDLLMFNIDDFDENSYPNFLVYFNDNDVVCEELWGIIYSWLKIILKNVNSSSNDIEKSIMFDAHFGGVEIIKSDNQELGICESIGPCNLENLVYEFEKRYLSDIDVCLYQVRRNETEVAFTVVVNNFKKVYNESDKVFFTDIYGSSAWDSNRIYARYDFTFLCKLWKHLGMAGEFNMDIVKERIDACYPDRLAKGIAPQQEPRVYRKTIDECIAHVYKLFGN
jgi:hypothetical protein